uniref:Uncharacterized protein LOC117361619 isoform X2 n=1 Tax=Geotrypetes seraphini TaxID=260995 RepID=A0A6P8RGA1_GEOSA|nr:uncharacterized protein LOC117361619 isoform X2 [Geotrypetes seraphini]
MRRTTIMLILQCLSFILLEAVLDQSMTELHKRLNDSVLLPGRNVSTSQVFSVEWKVWSSKSGEESYILTYSGSYSNNLFINDNYKQRHIFSQENFSLCISQLSIEDDGLYTQKITFKNGSSVTIKRKLTVYKHVTLHCSKMTGSTVDFSWQKCNQLVPDGNHTSLSQDSASLTIINVPESDMGNYRCVIQNKVSQGNGDIGLQLCNADPSKESSSCISCYCGYFGYPGYLGYICIFIFIFRFNKRQRKDDLYENTSAAKYYH